MGKCTHDRHRYGTALGQGFIAPMQLTTTIQRVLLILVESKVPQDCQLQFFRLTYFGKPFSFQLLVRKICITLKDLCKVSKPVKRHTMDATIVIVLSDDCTL